MISNTGISLLIIYDFTYLITFVMCKYNRQDSSNYPKDSYLVTQPDLE